MHEVVLALTFTLSNRGDGTERQAKTNVAPWTMHAADQADENER